MKNRIQFGSLFLVLLLQNSLAASQDLEWEVGLSSNRTVIRAQGITTGSRPAPTVLYLAGLAGETDTSDRVRSILNSYSQLDEQNRPVNLITIPIANPDAETLTFPPGGRAYSENPVANALWRWIGIHAPDLVIISSLVQVSPIKLPHIFKTSSDSK